MTWADIKIFLVFLLFAPLFFINIGKYGLTDYDEAWYAAISHNIITNRQPLLLSFNQNAYFDHPPLGFNLMAVSFLIFGVNEFAARFPSAFLGFLSLYLLYLIGKTLRNRGVGIGAALILVSCVWFIFRARTGNLDAPLIFFCLLSFFYALKIIKNPKMTREYVLFGLSFGLLLSVKSLFGLVLLLPVGLYIILNHIKISFKGLAWIFLAFMCVTLPWLLFSLATYRESYLLRMAHIGLRQWAHISPNWGDLLSSNTFIYLHSSIRKWYYPALLSIIFTIGSYSRRKEIWPVTGLVLFLFYSFVTNGDTSIWHLLPLLPFLALLLSFSVYELFYAIFSKINLRQPEKLGQILTIAIVGLVAVYQIYAFRNDIQLTAKGYSAWSQLAIEAGKRPEQLYLDGPDLWPTVVYYSQKKVQQIYGLNKPLNTLAGIISSGPKPFLLITENWRLNADNISTKGYEQIKDVDGRVLLLIR